MISKYRIYRYLCYGLLFSILVVLPAAALILPPDPFDGTDRYALLMLGQSGDITAIQAKVKPTAEMLSKGGELRAVLAFKDDASSREKGSRSVVSHAISVATLRPDAVTIVTFDLSAEPVLAEAIQRTLKIYYQHDNADSPELLAEYHPEQLLLRPDRTTIDHLAAAETARDGTLVFGPVTVLRERGQPITETILFHIDDPAGPFILRLNNGDAAGGYRVASAVVKLNGEEIFRPAEFNSQISGLSRQVVLLPGENRLTVRLRSAPGSIVGLEIVRQDGQVCRVFGPRTFTRATGKPQVETLSFSLADDLAGPYSLNLSSGAADGAHRVDSAVITLNGEKIITPCAFNEKVGQLSLPVSLQQNNTLRVELRGKPGDFLTLEGIAFDNGPPSVSVTSPVSGDIVTTSPITVVGVVDDPFATVTVNGVLAIVAADGTFSAAGLSLQEGENTLMVSAVDPCGNQGEETLSIFLQSAPRGPDLTLCAEQFVEQTPQPPAATCNAQALAYSYGLVVGLTDESVATVTVSGVLLEDGVKVSGQGAIYEGMREGNFFWTFIRIPEVDGIYPFTATVTNASGEAREMTVSFLRDTTPPKLLITAPPDGSFVSTATVTVHGTVDDPEATVRLDYFGQIIPVQAGVFSMVATVKSEGENRLIFSATDPYNNSTYGQLWIVRDTIAPVINLITPSPGTFVNTPVLSILGNVVDRNPSAVSVQVNDNTLQSLSLTGSSFSGTVALTDGANNLSLRAQDKAGNAGVLSRVVQLDRQPPVATILSPLPNAELTGNVTFTVAASDDLAGVASVALQVDSQLLATRNQPPFDFVLDTLTLPAGSHMVTARVTDKAGNVAEATLPISVPSQLGIEIVAPLSGAVLDRNRVLVQGTIRRNTEQEVGVVVNGDLAHVQGTTFALLLSLPPGTNTVTAIANGADGFKAEVTITLTVPATTEELQMTVFPESGIPTTQIDGATTFDTTFRAEAYLLAAVARYDWDTDGNGTIDQSGPDLVEITARYSTPGLYFPMVTVTDVLGNTATERAVVHILDRNALDALLQEKWEGMKAGLINQDIDAAVAEFAAGSREIFRPQFTALASFLPQIVNDMGEIKMVSIQSGRGVYDMRTVRNGEIFSFQLEFICDGDGLWRIRSF